MEVGDHGTTFGGSPLACAVGLHCFKRLNDTNLLKKVNSNSEFLLKEISSWEHPKIKEIRGKGLLLGIEYVEDPKEVIEKAQRKGLLLVGAGKNTIRIIPPLIISEDEIKEGLGILRSCL
eukprot:NODE_13_length_54415_cov_0.522424.p49 type:complete len:120 gc:universal NODE_13_length_54415_cov_0.522424:50177-50536(+)